MEERWWQESLLDDAPQSLVISLVVDTVEDVLTCVSIRAFHRETNVLIGHVLQPVSPVDDPSEALRRMWARWVEIVEAHVAPFPPSPTHTG